MLLTSLPTLTRPLAITHVNVVPMDTERVLADYTVSIEDGRISAVAPAGQFGALADSTQLVDGRGLYLMPGLADMHVHLREAGQSALFLANGVTFVRNMWGFPLHLSMQRTVERREWVGPRMLTTSPIVDGLNADGQPHWPGCTWLTDPAHAADLVRGYAERGYQQLKVYQFLMPDVHRALAAAAREFGLPVTGHCPDGMTFEQAIAQGQVCFEHLTGLGAGHLRNGQALPQIRRLASQATFEMQRETRRLLAEEIDFDALRRLAGQMAEQQIWNCPTSTVWRFLSQEPAQATRDPNLRYMTEDALGEWQRRLGVGASPERIQRRKQLMELQRIGDEARFRALKLLLDEGAPLLLGTDAPNPSVVPGFSIHQELENLVNAGFSPFQALRCGTSEAARFVGESDAWGTVAPGKRADLALLANNPLNDVHAASRPMAVFVNGFYLSRQQLDALLEQRASLVSATPEPVPLSSPPAGASVGRRGVLRASIDGRINSFITYRCSQLLDRGWLLEERRTMTWEPGREARRQVWLGTDFKLDRLEDAYVTLVGEARYVVQWADDRSTYELTSVALDGTEVQRTIGDRRLPLAWGLGVVALPHLVTECAEDTTVRVLAASFEPGAAGDFAPVDMRVTPVDDEAGARAWLVRVHGAAASERIYRFDADGHFLELRETFSGRSRRVVPHDQDVPKPRMRSV
jgi:imidazolonepropionase-like amidohydrolase